WRRFNSSSASCCRSLASASRARAALNLLCQYSLVPCLLSAFSGSLAAWPASGALLVSLVASRDSPCACGWSEGGAAGVLDVPEAAARVSSGGRAGRLSLVETVVVFSP